MAIINNAYARGLLCVVKEKSTVDSTIKCAMIV